MNTQQRTKPDRGSVIIMVMLIVVVLALVVIALADYAVATLRQGDVVENRADRLSAAEGAMRDTLDRLSGDGSLCTTSFGGSGTPQPFPYPLNGTSVSRTCTPIGATISEITGWAIVVTGEGGAPNGQGLHTQGGGDKVFGGETFVDRTSLMNLQKPLKIKEGNLWYTDPSCEPAGEYDPAVIPNLSFDPPEGNGLWCTSQTWQSLFPEPAVPNLAALTNRTNTAHHATTNPNGAYEDRGPCRVFFPGRYSFKPDFTDNVYMLPGDYLFAVPGNVNQARITIDKSIVTAGRPGISGDEQIIANDPCQVEIEDATVTGVGATFYLDGNTNIEIDKGTGVQSGALEIFRREQGPSSSTDYVSIHTLPTHSLNYSQAVLSTGSGNNKEMAIHGQIWAPRARVIFGNVTNDAKGQILGGAVVAGVDAQSSASASGFVIQVAGSPQEALFKLQATAEKDGTTIVQVVAQLRFDPPPTGSTVGAWKLAVNSWRVCDQSLC